MIDDDPDEEDMDDDNNRDHLIPCPSCKKMIYDQAERCPKCGQYLSDEEVDLPHPSILPRWAWWTVMIILIFMVLEIIFRF